MNYGRSNGISERLQSQIDDEVSRIVNENYNACKDILKANMKELHLLAKYLIAHEKIDGADFERLMKGEISEESIEADYKEYMEAIEKKKAEEEKENEPQTVDSASGEEKASETAEEEKSPDVSEENKADESRDKEDKDE